MFTLNERKEEFTGKIAEPIVLSAYRAFGIASSRLELIHELRDRGHTVVVIGSEDWSTSRLADVGAKFVPIGYRRGGFQAGDAVSLLRVAYRLRSIRPGLIVHFNLKPVFLGTIAAEVVPTAKSVCVITGFGRALETSQWTVKVIKRGLGIAADRNDAIVFQNSDDRDFTVEEGLVPAGKARVIVSSGVRTARFVPPERPRAGKEIRVLMVSRLLWQKGLGRFVDAARLLRDSHPHVRFVLGGEIDSMDPDGVSNEEIERWVFEGVIEFAGYIEDMPDALRSADVFVLPTTYREGVPRVILEASSAGLPVITVRGPGCREVVENGRTGYLLLEGTAIEIAEKVRLLASDPELRTRMGRAGRRLMTSRFDRKHVVRAMMELFEEIGAVALRSTGAP